MQIFTLFKQFVNHYLCIKLHLYVFNANNFPLEEVNWFLQNIVGFNPIKAYKCEIEYVREFLSQC